MSRWLRRASGRAWWLLLGAADATLGVLAVAEYAWLGWLLDTRYDLAAVTLVLASALAGLAATARVALRAAAGYRGLRRLVRDNSRPLPMAMRSAVATLGLAGSVEAVTAAQPFAVTVGLVRPRILVSDQLARALSAAELAAALAHERCHLRQRDPARLLAAYGWYLPAARWLAGRVALNRELAADRAALTRAGRGVLAGCAAEARRPARLPRGGGGQPGGGTRRVAGGPGRPA